MRLLIDYIDALIPLAAALVILLRPQILTKRDLALEENRGYAKKLRIAGILLIVAAMLIFIAQLGTNLANR